MNRNLNVCKACPNFKRREQRNMKRPKAGYGEYNPPVILGIDYLCGCSLKEPTFREDINEADWNNVVAPNTCERKAELVVINEK